MRMPSKHSDHKAKLSAEMVEESSWLNRNAPTLGRTAPEGYAERAKAFNAKCKELGATLMMVVEA